MSLLGRMADRLFGERKMNATLDLWRALYGGGGEAASGVAVNWKTALEVTTVLRCAQVIADGVATVPCKIMRVSGGRRQEAVDHPLTELIRVAPNDWQTGLEFLETLTFHLVLCRNAFVFLNRVNGRIVEMIPIEPAMMSVEQMPDWTLRYKMTGPDGQTRTVDPSMVWHLRGASWNSWYGLDAVRLAREAIGLSLATESAHARLHRNGAQPGGLYSVEGTLNESQVRALRGWVREQVTGANRFMPLILDRAAKWVQTSMTGVDAQHLETRRYQVEEVCRAMGVMPIMVGYSDKTATYASAEQMFLAHAVHTVRPWHRRFEASMYRALLSPDERRAGAYFQFFDQELLRGAAKDRGEYYARGIQSGWMTRNEARAFEDMDAIEGLDEPLSPVNMVAGNPPTADDLSNNQTTGAA